jgi:hypothetical protein
MGKAKNYENHKQRKHQPAEPLFEENSGQEPI